MLLIIRSSFRYCHAHSSGNGMTSTAEWRVVFTHVSQKGAVMPCLGSRDFFSSRFYSPAEPGDRHGLRRSNEVVRPALAFRLPVSPPRFTSGHQKMAPSRFVAVSRRRQDVIHRDFAQPLDRCCDVVATTKNWFSKKDDARHPLEIFP